MRQQRIVLVFSVLTALFAAGYGVMFTVLDEFRDDYGISSAALGVVVAVGFFSSFAAQVLLAPLADRGHARQMVYLGLALNVTGMLAMAAARDVVILLIARVVMGLGAGAALPALRRIVVLADPDHLGNNMGRLLAADVAGFASGPAISAVLVGPFGIPAPFLVIAVATAACVPLFARVHVVETPDDAQPQARLAFDLLRIRPFAGAVALGAAAFMMIGTFDSLWVLVLDDLRAADWIANLGIILFALPLMFLGAVGGRLSQRIGPFRVGAVGLLMGAGYMFAYGQMPTAAGMFAVAMVHSLSDGLTMSASGVAVGLTAPPERQAGAQGLLGGIQTLVGGVAAIVAGSLYEHQGRATAYAVCTVAMVVLTATGVALAGRAWTRRPDAGGTESGHDSVAAFTDGA